MRLTCETVIAAAYKSASQQARVISESWFETNAYCLACTSESLLRTTANTAATDFLCASCNHAYELKTFRTHPGRSIPDGAYTAFISRIQAGLAPTLCLLERSENWEVRSLTAIHSSLITDWSLERRPALSPDARRAGWVGCNIRLDRIPRDAEIEIVKNGVERPKAEIRREFQRFLPLAELPAERRGWTTLTLEILRRLPTSDFTLSEVYAREKEFTAIYPNNRHVRAKIRQQLQTLRDLGVLTFRGGGKYSISALANS